ncbi:MAG: hypothetical protein KatS3mg114_0356 [Planctomycetaceae bacterium]|nr:MAG: hypothetical protein KatS3mg114_0356 [Planctomycetaceae bacterium]
MADNPFWSDAIPWFWRGECIWKHWHGWNTPSPIGGVASPSQVRSVVVKTRLLQQLHSQLDPRLWCVFSLDCRGLTASEFISKLACQAGCGTASSWSDARHWLAWEDCLYGQPELQRQVVMMLDHADQLVGAVEPVVWRLWRTLSQPQIAGTLILAQQAPLSASLLSRCDLCTALEPWSPDECSEFIELCLRQAGSLEPAFTAEALRVIGDAADGWPGPLLRLCGLVWESALVLQQPTISPSLVFEILREYAPLPVGASQHTPQPQGQAVG